MRALRQLLNKIEWIVTIYDKPGVDRLKFRPQHLANVPTLMQQGFMVNGGPIFTDETRTNFIGSHFNIIAKDKKEIIDTLRKDIYSQEGIWDFDTIVIHPHSSVKTR